MLLSFLGFGFAAAVVLFLVASAGAGFMLWKVSQDLPDYESLSKYEPPVMTRIHAHNGALIAEYARERRIFVPINTIPKRVIAAFLSAEDSRFYEHGGVDFQGIARAVFKLVEAKIEGRSRRVEGASTITQQVAKNFLLTQRALDRAQDQGGDPRHPHRARLPQGQDPRALSQRDLPRDRRLRRGGGESRAISTRSWATSPSRRRPISRRCPRRPTTTTRSARPRRRSTRRNWIIGQMYENGYITAEQAEAAKAKPLGVNIRPTGAHIFAAEYFAEEVRRTLLTAYGEDKLYGGGLSVRTTLDPHLQQIARQALSTGSSPSTGARDGAGRSRRSTSPATGARR